MAEEFLDFTFHSYTLPLCYHLALLKNKIEKKGNNYFNGRQKQNCKTPVQLINLS